MIKKWAISVAIILIQSTFIYVPNANALKAACGQFRIVKGDVKFSEKSGSALALASPNRKVCTGGTVVTGKDSRALVMMPGGDELHVSPDSKIVLQDIKHEDSGKKKKVLIDLLYGKMRANVQKNTYSNEEDNQFRVKTKTAVAGVRGTQFLTSFSNVTQASEVVTFEGVVEVGKPSGSGFNFSDSVQVSAGQKTFTNLDSKPATPAAVPKQEMQKLDQTTKQDTTQEPPSSTDKSVNGEKNGSEKQTTQEKTPEKAPPTATNKSEANRTEAARPNASKPDASKPDTNRSVSSVPANPDSPKEMIKSPTMITNDDLGKAPPIVPTAGMTPPTIFVPPQLMPIVPGTVCNFCNERIINGDAKVNINVIIKQ